MPSKTKQQPTIIGKSWRFDELWNHAIDSLPERPLVKRNHIWASELGSDFCSRYLKMNAVPYSNAPTMRSRRKFTSGHIWEWIIGLVLTAAGILKAKQLRGEVELPNLLRVSGKLDFVAGGNIDWDTARLQLQNIQTVFATSMDDMPLIINHAIKHVFETFRKQFQGSPMREYILESKSIGSWMQKKVEGSNKPMEHHVFQTAHYLFANKDIQSAKIIYISKDDATTYEFDIERTKEIKKIYTEDVKQMTEYYNQGFDSRKPLRFAPPTQPEVYFSEGLWTFRKNFYVEYNNYLSMLYPYKNLDEFKLKWDKTLTQWNRTFKRCVTGANMTPLNKTVIAEATKVFKEWDKYVQIAKKEGAFQKPEENDED